QEFDTQEDAERTLRSSGNNPAVFDGDGLTDTPADPFIRSLGCGATSSVTLNGLSFELPRTNVMSYYDAPSKALSAQQIDRVRQMVRGRFPSYWWSDWNLLGGVVTSTPAVAREADGRLAVFVRGTDGQLMQRRETAPGGNFSPWVSLG